MSGTEPARTTAYPSIPKHAFVDAYGTASLEVEKDAVTTYFIVAAILVDGDRVSALRAQVNEVRAKYFGPGPMKSKACKEARRMKVLHALHPIDFKFVAVAVDKSRVLRDSGLVFSEPFVKFIHRKLLDRLFTATPDLHVIADRYGDSGFMEDFKRYVLKNRRGFGQCDLFRKAQFDFAVSTEEPLVQLADFMAGSLSRIYDPKKKSPAKDEIHDLLRSKALFVDDWPKRFRAPLAVLVGGSPHDDVLRRYCIERVYEFLHVNRDSEDPEILAQVEAASYLLFAFDSISESEWIRMDRLREVLEGLGLPIRSKHQVYTRVIAKLRDAGVIIASSPHGYKIPANLADVLQFVERADTIVIPMLNRLQGAREALHVATGGAVDIVSADRFAGLRDALGDRSFELPDDNAKKAG